MILQRFLMLDKDQDGYLTEDDVMVLPAGVVEAAFGHLPPGEVWKWKLSSDLFDERNLSLVNLKTAK